mmetsp:Transcript_30389/g.69961  ORF Transcript_30389/g.69961 Transcript_30389/m.69961 type:complete len:204 (-) Transcript_30389:727-1338(-)
MPNQVPTCSMRASWYLPCTDSVSSYAVNLDMSSNLSTMRVRPLGPMKTAKDFFWAKQVESSFTVASCGLLKPITLNTMKLDAMVLASSAKSKCKPFSGSNGNMEAEYHDGSKRLSSSSMANSRKVSCSPMSCISKSATCHGIFSVSRVTPASIDGCRSVPPKCLNRHHNVTKPGSSSPSNISISSNGCEGMPVSLTNCRMRLM